ncbi:MAG: hypothetical protein IJ680_08245 [Paludibacteraceae bacterium]|nr:hypothetical protein [Paludibacteraceae bacterium]
MSVIVRNRLLPPGRFVAMNLFGIIFVRKGCGMRESLLRHERTHTRQMLELLVLPFYVLYVSEWLLRLLLRALTLRERGGVSVRRWLGKAYDDISFEREAYANQADVHYLQHRPHFAWLRYF